MPAPGYPEYPELWEQARRGAPRFVDIAYIDSVEAITQARGADWCTAVLGRPFAGLQNVDTAEAELLRLAHQRDLDPPLPDEVVAERQAAAEHRAVADRRRQQQGMHDRREWTAALGQASVPAGVLQVRANVRGGGRPAHRGGGPLQHVVPAVDVWSGPGGRPRRHPAGRALCESEHRRRPVQLGEPSNEPATCVRCLAWVAKVRPAPEVGAAPSQMVADPAQRAQPGGDAVAAGLQEAPVVDPNAVLAAARAATAHNRGRPVRGCHVFNNAVWVDLTSWPRARETATYLAELGYQLSGPSPGPDGYGWSVTVSGWSADGLAERVVELERAVHDLELHHGDVASAAVGRYRDYLRQGWDVEAARRQAVEALPPAPHAPAGLGSAVSERDLTYGPSEHRAALVRVAAAQRAWRMLAATDAARAAIDMYVECRQVHRYPVDRAQAAAVAEVSEGARAGYEVALATLNAKLEAAGRGTAGGGHHGPALPVPDARSARPTRVSPSGSTGMRPPPSRTAGRTHHRGR